MRDNRYFLMFMLSMCVLALQAGGCGDAESDTAKNPGTDNMDTATDDGTESGRSTASEGDSATGGQDSDSATDSQFGLLGNRFRFGINGGHRNQSWGDDVQAELEARAGCNSQRISLPERHLDKWGYEIEVGDMNAYQTLGMHSQVAFLTSPIRAHSTAPSDVEDWELAYYIPKNLYEPVTLPSGEINPENYWGKYVYDTVKIYSPWIRVWEIWNEPDYTPVWEDTLTWTDSAPTAAQLPRFNGSIYEYVRMLRVSREAATLANPDALIATGGIGYASFLSAILRYSDNPVDGTVTNAYPQLGGAYFDVLSFHHYPIYTSGSSDDAVAGFVAHAEELLQVCRDAGKLDLAGIEVTESGAPTVAVGDYPGSDLYARNYLMKVMVTAHNLGIHGIDWFTLSDSANEGESDNPYHYMGLFEDVVSLDTIDEATIKESGVALATLGELLRGAVRVEDDGNQWAFPAGVKGVKLLSGQGKDVYVLWANTPDDDASNVPFTLPSGTDNIYDVYHWDYSRTREADMLDGTNTTAIALNATPVILVAR
jgi:hypothetical protein